ncbi:MAG: ATP-binding cassette domain-containing protein, partial [Deltaproteobacteria bacterium]|nr:ATP-binding cassette domain-containing protein [Deltaproteobacteria bacterium]
MRHITKHFPMVVANDDVNFRVPHAEIHALVGENGAGKSTLMNILYGLLRPDSGNIAVNGTEVRFSGPADAINNGIGMVHQHFMLIPTLTVAENVVLGCEPSRLGLMDIGRASQIVGELSDRYGLKLDPSAKVDVMCQEESEQNHETRVTLSVPGFWFRNDSNNSQTCSFC